MATYNGVLRTADRITATAYLSSNLAVLRVPSRIVGGVGFPASSSLCWVRELRPPGTATYWITPGITFMKTIAMFLERVLGYVFRVEGTAGATSFRSFEKSGSFGSFSGANKNFVDSVAAAFASGDVGKSLAIRSTTGWNGGIYRISGFTDANTITLDTRTAPTEYPSAESNLSWWLYGDQYQLPTTLGDYCRYLSPAGWGIQLTFARSATYDFGFYIYISPNNVWTGPSAKTLGPIYFGGNQYLQSGNPVDWYMYVFGSRDGTKLMAWAENSVYGGIWGWSAGIMTPTEAGHSADELVYLTGASGIDVSNGQASWLKFNRDTSNGPYGGLGHVVSWIDNRWYQQNGYLSEYAPGAYTTGFCRGGLTQLNQRTGKNDIMQGSLFLQDPGNASGDYEFKGIIDNHFSIRNNIGRRLAFDVDGTRDKFHIYDGIAISWPGVTPQF